MLSHISNPGTGSQAIHNNITQIIYKATSIYPIAGCTMPAHQRHDYLADTQKIYNSGDVFFPYPNSKMIIYFWKLRKMY